MQWSILELLPIPLYIHDLTDVLIDSDVSLCGDITAQLLTIYHVIADVENWNNYRLEKWNTPNSSVVKNVELSSKV